MRNFFVISSILLLISCSNNKNILKKRYYWGYRVLNSKANEFNHNKNSKNADNWSNNEKNENIDALSYNDLSNHLSSRNNSSKVEFDFITYSKPVCRQNNTSHQNKNTKASQNHYNTIKNLKRIHFKGNFSKRIPLVPESGSFFYVWGIFGSIFLAIFLAAFYILIISGIILITYNPNLFLIFMSIFIVAAIVIGILYLLNAD